MNLLCTLTGTLYYVPHTLAQNCSWIEDVLSCELPVAPDLEDALQNGVILCKLGMKLLPDDPMWNRVYDINQSKFKVS